MSTEEPKKENTIVLLIKTILGLAALGFGLWIIFK